MFFFATQKSSVISPGQDGKEEEYFSLADKYSNQMSVPLGDPPNYPRIKSNLEKGSVWAVLRVYLNLNV